MEDRKVSVICIDCDSNMIDQKLMSQTYGNLEVVEAATGAEFFSDIAGYIDTTDSDYICFLEKRTAYMPQMIETMMSHLEENAGVGTVLCGRNYIDAEGTVLATGDIGYRESLSEHLYHGGELVGFCLDTGNNLLGTISNAMFRRGALRMAPELFEGYSVTDGEMQKLLLFFHMLIGTVVQADTDRLVSTEVAAYDEQLLRQQILTFQKEIAVFVEKTGMELDLSKVYGICPVHADLLYKREIIHTDVKKEITLFYQDKGEYYNLLPIKEEAQKRGYLVKESDNLDEPAQIGVYCQHFGKPENAKFSLVLLHDMAQGHNRWPNLWELERWNTYDIGILPGGTWGERWEQCAFYYYVNPRCGAYTFGYPKSDYVNGKEITARKEEIKKAFQMKYDTTVLYAPSWENDEKEDDFVRALASLEVNLVIKQAHWPSAYQSIIDNIKEMKKLHEGKYENVYYIEPTENILVALDLCDIVVSDESSVMTEALMYGKPSIAITDWLIPDTSPSRFASTPFEFVCRCKKVELREKIERFLKDRNDIDTDISSDAFFSNTGKVNAAIMDAIDYYTGNGSEKDFEKWRLKSRYMPVALWN